MTESELLRRRDLRVTYRSTVSLKFADGRPFDNCQTSNISVSGVFVAGVSGVKLWDKCAVAFQLIGRSSSLVLAMTGQVVRVQDDGVALQFDEVGEDSFCHLQNIVYSNYRQQGQFCGSEVELATHIEDESLYLGMPGATGKPLPDIYLSDGRDDDYFGFSDDLDGDIIDRIDSQKDEEDY
jgi:hypothetical protein